jgi:gamma-glutamylcyclotransferase
MEPIWTTAPFALVAAYRRSSVVPAASRATGFASISGRPRGKAAPANLHRDPGAEVWGVLYRITRRDLLRLDSTEGVPGRGYRHIEIAAEDRNGRVVQAVTYMAQGNEVDGKPSLRYITLLRDGARAHGLPETHIRFLESVEHVQ